VIEGFASPEKTRSWTRLHPEIAFREMGETGLSVSQAGFGCYRVTVDVPRHKNALEKALTSGINLVDTSTNYADGGSETLVGRVLTDLIKGKTLTRQQLVVVSKAGYVQGENYDLGRERAARGNPFSEMVDFGRGLAHCIHPDFLADQLQRSRSRMNLATLDFYLLHNPEYYLEWAVRQGMEIDAARSEYERRLRAAFTFLEEMVEKEYIRYYGVSSNTLPEPSDHPEFTSLEELWRIAGSISREHHFRLIQMPFNLLERGAALQQNQSGDKTVLALAHELKLAVLVNRPLNAFTGDKLMRLADLAISRRQPTGEIIRHIQLLGRSEKVLPKKFLPSLNLPVPLQNRIKEQLAVGDVLKHHWRNFGTYDRWRDVKNGNILPRLQGVMDFLTPHKSKVEGLSGWMADHTGRLETALDAVESIYSEAAAVEAGRLAMAAADADTDWAAADTLSRKAVCALRSTTGVTSVLVGMRKEAYVADVLAGLKLSIPEKPRTESWKRLDRNAWSVDRKT
jgi:aryl-alcohol dehydrogenase-like predicted oxidoreductase